MEYEFSDDDASLIKRVGFRLTVQGILLALTGFFGILYVVVSGTNDIPSDMMAFLMQSIMEVIMGSVLLLSPRHFTKVATTEGTDIKELIVGLNKLSMSFMIIWIIVVLNTIIDLSVISGGA